MPNKAWHVVGVVLRVLLALLFAVSAVAKLFAIDDFELYIFSYGFFSLNFCYIVARLCIGAEMALALLFASGLWRRWVCLAAVLLLTGFSLFLCYAMLVGRSDSCQCFGRLADMSPSVSLVKNAVLLVIVLLYMKSGRQVEGSGKRVVTFIFALSSLILIGVPFAVSVPDNWMFGPEDVRFDKSAFADAIGEGGGLSEYSIDEGRRLVAFVTPGCPYCRMTRQKLGSIAERHKIADGRIIYIEPEQIGVPLFMAVTHGMRPLVMLVDDGEVKTTYHYRNINERQVAEFLNEGVDK